MTEFTVDMVDGEEQTLKLFDYVPVRLGREVREIVDVKAEGKGKTVKYKMENPNAKMEEAKEELVKGMIEKSGVDIDYEMLAYHSVNRIAEHYWKQVKGERAKNSAAASDDT